MDGALALAVLAAVADSVGVIDVATVRVYVFFLVTPLGFLRLYVDNR